MNPFVLTIHLAATLTALGLGAWQLASVKGTAPHRLRGRAWAALMVVVAVSSFWLSSPNKIPNFHGFSPTHGLSAFTLFSLAMGIHAIRRGRQRAHRFWMIGPYIGLIGAGTAAVLVPGRFLYLLLFG
ncbi:MAG: DUF2306 domain-containing protein [Proteobacteria bacterium]|nr:DUF2306 domain-containing protein [Pseudomonadota bacterium]